MSRYLSSVLGLAACVTMASVADAQMIRIGPYGGGGVDIRVPFVRVNVLPYGMGTHVRAPLTSVNTGAFAYGPVYRAPVYYGPRYYNYHVVPEYQVVPVYPELGYSAPVYPETEYSGPVSSNQVNPRSDYRVARPSYENDSALPDRLRQSAEALKRSLAARRGDGDIWVDYLNPDRIIDVIDRDGSPELLRELSANYEGVVGNPDLAPIRSARGFAQTYQLLRQFVSVVDEANDGQQAQSLDSREVPAPEIDKTPDQPTPAAPIKPADDGDEQGNVEQQAQQKAEAKPEADAKPEAEELPPAPVPL